MFGKCGERRERAQVMGQTQLELGEEWEGGENFLRQCPGIRAIIYYYVRYRNGNKYFISVFQHAEYRNSVCRIPEFRFYPHFVLWNSGNR